jgi:hypothetical protein
MEVSGKFHAPVALPMGKEYYKGGCGVIDVEKIIIRFLRQDSPARSLVTTLTELPLSDCWPTV